MLGSQDQAVLQRRVRRDHQIHRGVGGYGSRPLHVKISLGRGAVRPVRIVDPVHARIVPVDDYLRRVGGISGEKKTAETVHLSNIDVGFIDDRNRLPTAVCSSRIQRVQIVLNGKISRREDKVVGGHAAAANGPLRRRVVRLRIVLRLAQVLDIAPGPEVVQRHKAAHHRRNRRRNLRIAGIGVMGFAIHLILMDLRVKRPAHLRHVAAELDGLLTRIHLGHAKSVPRQPGLNGRDILVRRPELLAKLIRRQPFVIAGRSRRVQIADELVQRRFLAVAAL